MARTVKDANLQSREARRRLKARGKPHYKILEEGLHLGYRKPRSGAGKWVARRYVGKQSYEVEVIALADDLSDSNDATVLSFDQAQRRARELRDMRDRAAAGKTDGRFTVADAMDLYIKFLENEGRSEASIVEVRYRDRAFIRPKLGDMEAGAITTEEFTDWRDAIAKAPRRLRTRPNEEQKYREAAASDDERRARRASAKRIWNDLRAALNHAYRLDKVGSDKEWKKVKSLTSVDGVRVRYLTIAEATRLTNACDLELRAMVQAGLLTGGRYGQLAKLTVGDFNPDAGTLTMRTRKGRGDVKSYHVHLTAEAVEFFRAACAKRDGAGDLIFKKADGSGWKKADQIRLITEASVRAKINPPANFHITRHTWASHAVMNGMSLMVVAQNLGHRDTKMVELHYGHLAPSYRQNQVREFAPTFGIKPDIRTLGPAL
jgi:integrase